jgi:preprotein translocase subunit YajC
MNHILLMSGGGGGSQGTIVTMVTYGGILAVMYFLILRPQQKKQKEQRGFRENIKEGDQVVMISGLHGKVKSVEEHTVIIETESGQRLRFERSSISPETTAALQKRTAAK